MAAWKVSFFISAKTLNIGIMYCKHPSNSTAYKFISFGGNFLNHDCLLDIHLIAFLNMHKS